MSRNFRLTICVLFASTLVWAAAFPSLPAPQAVDFARDIQPIFNAHCVSCHGAKKAAGQLRLDNKSAAMKGGISGAVILPNNSKASILLARVTGSDGQARMPMGGDPLKPEQIELLRQWINEGAAWPSSDASQISNLKSEIPTHWAYKKPVRPALPTVKNQAWSRNPIDNFVLARLEKEGLQPSPEASKETLLRRVYLDLIGLPPSVKEIDEFLNDNSPNAYEKVVDKLLASKHYGERWARLWLDLARYADSNGYEKDRPRVMWKYRDWVINALNADLPFDQFTIEQIAGDMLPKPTTDQLIATGFHRNTLLNQEGGVDDEEARFETLIDRVNTTATVWLGTTLGCAQCHNHKYDPFSQRDYYKLMAFFDNHEYKILELGNSEGWVVEPELEMPTPEQAAQRKKLRSEIALLEARLKADTPELTAAQAAWERAQLNDAKQWLTLDPTEFTSTGGTTFTKLADKSLLAGGANPEREEYVIKAPTNLQTITGLRLEVLPDERLPRGGPGRDPYGNFVLSKVEISANGKRLELAKAKVDNAAGTFNSDRFLFAPVRTAANDNPGGWQIDATRDPQGRMPRQMAIRFDEPLVNATELTIKLRHLAGGLGQGLGRVRLSVTNVADSLAIARIPAALKPVLAMPAAKRSQKQAADLKKLFRELTPLFKTERERLIELKYNLDQIKVVTALVMGEKLNYERPSTWFHERGAYLNTTEKVYATTPAVLPPLPEHAPVNRLGLAYWLVDENNPLTARVTVNRFWEAIFGRGLVLTSEDFGTQGEAPSHPELLDWLAVTFRDGIAECGVRSADCDPKSKATTAKWSMKALHRLIVTSATYRQSSAFTPRSALRTPQSEDPYNRLLARGPRFRVEAEMVRDIGLTASGLLSRKIGGPSVFPLQPEGIWKNPYSNEKWQTSKDEDRYRRSLYTFIRRTSPHPAMMTFDASSREVCTVRRARTNTPLQSLTSLNDEAAMDNARALAQRMTREGGDELKAQLIYGFRLCTSRQPKAAEIDRLLALYEQQLQLYRNDEKAARLLTKAIQSARAELAARVIVANVLLNLDETLTKE
jgi:mono/diheme cytochrome c family protein